MLDECTDMQRAMGTIFDVQYTLEFSSIQKNGSSPQKCSFVHNRVRSRRTSPRSRPPRALTKEKVLRSNIFAEQLWRKPSHQWSDTQVQRRQSHPERLSDLREFIASPMQPFRHLPALCRDKTWLAQSRDGSSRSSKMAPECLLYLGT